jgi:hypothetical protein
MPWLWPYGGVALVVIVAMWPAFTTTSRLVIGGDGLLGYYPWFVFWRDQISAGELPLWNPYTFSGMPAFATPHSGYAYPVNWLLTPLPPIVAFNWTIGLHMILAGVGTAWCARHLGASKEGQFLAGVAFALGGAMAARLVAGHLYFVIGLAWLPLVTGLAISIDRRYGVPLLAIAMGLLVTASQPELVIFAGWWLPLWSGWLAMKHGKRAAAVAVGRTLAASVIGLGIGAFFLLPAEEFQAVSNRAGALDWDFRTGISLPFWHVLTAVHPDIFGSPTGSYWPEVGYFWHERLLYVGLIPLVLAFFARGRAAWLCFAGAALAILLAFGRYFPLFGLVDNLPVYDLFRNPPKHLILASLGLALAAGVGVSRINERSVAVAATVCAVVCLIASLTVESWLPAFVEVLGDPGLVTTSRELRMGAYEAKDPLLISALLLAGVALVGLLPRVWAIRGFLALAVLELFVLLQPYWSEPVDPRGIEQELLAFKGATESDPDVAVMGPAALIANYGSVAKVRQPAGYNSIFLGNYMELATGVRNPGVIVDIAPEDERILYLLGYEAVTVRGSNLVRVFNPPPRLAWVARCSWPGGALEARESGFPLAQCVTRESVAAPELVAEPGPAEIEKANEANLSVQAEGPGWLVTTIPWAPGWTASVDGKNGNVEVLDGALIGVELPPGQHTVELSYWPAGLTLGLLISGLSLIVVAGLWYAERRGMWWTRLGLEPADGVVADEADDEGNKEAPEDDLTQPPSP